VTDFEDNAGYSYYTVPYENRGKKQLYIYLDLFESGKTQNFDLSGLEEYSVEVIEKSANIEYTINETLVTATSGELQGGAASLVLCLTKTNKLIEARMQEVKNIVEEFDPDKEYCALLAFYDGETCLGAQVVGNRDDGLIEDYSEISCPDGTKKVKAFIWESFANLNPLTNVIK